MKKLNTVLIGKEQLGTVFNSPGRNYFRKNSKNPVTKRDMVN